MNRRDFLRRTGMTASALAVSSMMTRTALAATELDRYFIHVYFEGGWDQLLALDPRDPAQFHEGNMVQTGIQPAYDRLPAQFSRDLLRVGPHTFGPCVGELVDVADEINVVRGINMGTLTHEVGRRYFVTGRVPSGLTARGSSVPTLAAAQTLLDRPVPHLSHLVENYNVDQPAWAAALPVASVDHLQYILQESLGIPTGVPDSVKDALGAYWSQHRDCRPEAGASASRLADRFRENRDRAREVVQSNLHRSFQFAGPETAAVRAHYGLDAAGIESPLGRAALAAQALKTGLSRVVSVALASQLDTHDNTWANDHSTRLEAGFTALARLIKDLRDSPDPMGQGSLLSKTTIVVFSEFTRSTRLNARNGRDHHLCNSALLVGGGLRRGVRVGATSDTGMGPLPINLATGLADEAGVTLTPEHVLTTALNSAGMSAESLRSEPIPALLP
jgi:uncharacterized protein (DUF1501 family)